RDSARAVQERGAVPPADDAGCAIAVSCGYHRARDLLQPYRPSGCSDGYGNGAMSTSARPGSKLGTRMSTVRTGTGKRRKHVFATVVVGVCLATSLHVDAQPLQQQSQAQQQPPQAQQPQPPQAQQQQQLPQVQQQQQQPQAPPQQRGPG